MGTTTEPIHSALQALLDWFFSLGTSEPIELTGVIVSIVIGLGTIATPIIAAYIQRQKGPSVDSSGNGDGTREAAGRDLIHNTVGDGNMAQIQTSAQGDGNGDRRAVGGDNVEDSAVASAPGATAIGSVHIQHLHCTEPLDRRYLPLAPNVPSVLPSEELLKPPTNEVEVQFKPTAVDICSEVTRVYGQDNGSKVRDVYIRVFSQSDNQVKAACYVRIFTIVRSLCGAHREAQVGGMIHTPVCKLDGCMNEIESMLISSSDFSTLDGCVDLGQGCVLAILAKL